MRLNNLYFLFILFSCSEKVKKDLDSWEIDKEIYVDFVLKSRSPIQLDYC